MSVKWEKTSDGKVAATHPNLHWGFTVAELQEGLRIATEKPVFEGTRGDTTYRFQKRNGKVVFTLYGDTWSDVESTSLGFWPDSCLEAILQARRS